MATLCTYKQCANIRKPPKSQKVTLNMGVSGYVYHTNLNSNAAASLTDSEIVFFTKYQYCTKHESVWKSDHALISAEFSWTKEKNLTDDRSYNITETTDEYISHYFFEK